MNPSRARCLKPGETIAGPIVYWMSRDQRSHDNWALLYAQQQALLLKSPVRVLFTLVPNYLAAYGRQYDFMLAGLREVAIDLARKNISFEILCGNPSETILHYLHENDISMLITDFDPLRIKQAWKQAVMAKTTVPVYEVDAHNVIPCWIASLRQEYSAYTLRPKIIRQLSAFTEPFPPLQQEPYGSAFQTRSPDWNAIRDLHSLKPNRIISTFPAGQSAAPKKMHSFIENGIGRYYETRNDPSLNGQSKLSPYIHFGQLSTLRILLTISNSHSIQTAQEVFFGRTHRTSGNCRQFLLLQPKL